MIFNEVYSAYYNAIAQILTSATEGHITAKSLRQIIEDKAFSESFLTIESALANEKWQLLKTDGTTTIKNTPTMPLTILQKKWLKAISLDSRIKLFDIDFSGLDGIEPLFTPEDLHIFDKYSDGDSFEDPEYIAIFKLILASIKNQKALRIVIKNRKGTCTNFVVMPEHLEYSEKDDKFRLIASGSKHGHIINLGRILKCQLYDKPFNWVPNSHHIKKKSVTVELFDDRNALERALLHFAHFEKEAQRIDNRLYRIKINYSKDDEIELVIRILSYGPFIKVIEPESFVNLIKERLTSQITCEL
ncbi:MAG: WYL domain-containing protein [Clostridiales bacterium]|jgi:hypothetical protein|nr:WYL domain-containing protein [Clostridiales bacterium]